jgi:hypothetical protein
MRLRPASHSTTSMSPRLRQRRKRNRGHSSDTGSLYSDELTLALTPASGSGQAAMPPVRVSGMDEV